MTGKNGFDNSGRLKNFVVMLYFLFRMKQKFCNNSKTKKETKENMKKRITFLLVIDFFLSEDLVVCVFQGICPFHLS